MRWELVDVPGVERWYALDVMIESTAREAVEYALMEAGSLGTEFNETSEELARVTAYFASTPDREQIRQEVLESLRIYALPPSSVRHMELREVENQDWLGAWKKTWQPVEVGARFVVAPPWSEISDNHARIVIRIESIDEMTSSANLVCANLTAPVIVKMLPRLVGASCGRLVLSGVLDSQVEMIIDGLRKLGINDVVEISSDGEWVAVVV